jgi:HPt (histidine-containing phosphotransfer) domain-containing protein
MASNTIDLSMFNNLRAMVGADFIGELVDTFLEDSPELIRQMDQALANGDTDTFRRAAHSLKSNSANFGATRLAEQARMLEMMAKEGRLDQVGDSLDEVEAEFSRVKTDLEALRDGA